MAYQTHQDNYKQTEVPSSYMQENLILPQSTLPPSSNDILHLRLFIMWGREIRRFNVVEMVTFWDGDAVERVHVLDFGLVLGVGGFDRSEDDVNEREGNDTEQPRGEELVEVWGLLEARCQSLGQQGRAEGSPGAVRSDEALTATASIPNDPAAPADWTALYKPAYRASSQGSLDRQPMM
jgi:hypothetical protein